MKRIKYISYLVKCTIILLLYGNNVNFVCRVYLEFIIYVNKLYCVSLLIQKSKNF